MSLIYGEYIRVVAGENFRISQTKKDALFQFEDKAQDAHPNLLSANDLIHKTMQPTYCRRYKPIY